MTTRNVSQKGAALLIVLAFVVLLTVLSVAFFSRAAVDRQVSFSSSNQTKADLLARGALAVTVGDLKQELAAGSTISTASGVTIYSPKAPATVVPALVGSSGTGGLENLVKRSVNAVAFYPTNANYDTVTYPAPKRAAGPSTSSASTIPSLNGRSVSKARWNKSFLLKKANLTADDNAAPVGAFVVPDWISVARNGSNPTTWNANMITSPTSTSSVIARYAYAIYDEGGLLDMNVAGHPTVNTTVQVGRKGLIAFADPTQIPGVGPGAGITGLTAANQTKLLNNIVGWRNYSSAAASGSLGTFASAGYTVASGTPFFSSVLANTNGFLLTSNTTLNSSQSDRIFTSRQQLIALLLRGMPSTDTDRANLQVALEYLGSFSREFNRPTWTPALNATDMGAATNGTNNIYAYNNNANAAVTPTPTPINKNVATLRTSGITARADGSSALAGEPLMKRRFPLSRISGLGTNGTLATGNTTLLNGVLVPASAATIQRDFGLQWDSTNKRWNYVGATGSTVQSNIERLDQVAAENREPNFFEILKAVILNGSLGLGSGPADTFVAHEAKYYDNSSGLGADYQIIQIGANIIDGWDSDNIPTFIGFKDPSNSNVYEAAGIENLPYLNKIVFCARVPSSSGTVDAWLVPSLWNPHQNGSVVTATGNRVRIALTGSPSYTAAFTVGSTMYTTNAIVMSPTPSMDVAANGFMAPTPPQDPAPAPLAPPLGAVTSVNDGLGPEKYYGFHFVFTTPPTASQVNRNNLDTTYPDFGPTTTGNAELQVQLPDATYKTYQKWSIAAINHPLTAQSVKNNGDWQNTNKMVDPEFVALDPRTLRFGVWGTDANGQGGGNAKKDGSYGAEDSLDQAAPANRIELITYSRPQGTSFTVGTLPADLSLYATNGTASNHYVDLDGVQRRGDWTTDANGTNKGTTIMYGSAKTPPAGNYFDRPQILNGSFQSVAELGQVFRDQPWKTLNFTIANSGDAGLLDAFTLQDVPLTAGRTSLNTRQSPVLAAIISQGGLRIDGSSIITSIQATNVANAVVTATTANPLVSKGDLVARIAANASFTGLLNKEARECVMRALTDAGQTRTWNLMIDVIAQSGRYPSTASNLSQFVVEGEKRYWLHIAIDRFTGEVIDQQLEAVYE